MKKIKQVYLDAVAAVSDSCDAEYGPNRFYDRVAKEFGVDAEVLREVYYAVITHDEGLYYGRMPAPKIPVEAFE